MTSTLRLNRVVSIGLLLLLFMLIACGGGGNSGGGNNPPNQNPSNPAPVVSGISPTSSVVGSADTQVTVSGAGFVSSSSVQWNGASRPTTFVSATELQATVHGR